MVTDLILELKRKGKTIFLNTHNLAEAQKICDRIGILKTTLLTVNTPDQLQRTIWGNKTVFQLQEVTEAILSAVKTLTVKPMTVDQHKIIVEIDDPLEDNPRFVRAIVSAGGNIQFITQLDPDLAETYLKVIEEPK